MSLTQTYYLAHTARAKLSKEASRADHDLRLLVGHANLLDGLMLDLVQAEREQESWFNQTVKVAAEEQKHIKWADSVRQEPTITEDYEEDSEDSDSDSEDEQVAATLTSLRNTQPTVQTIEIDDDVEEDDEEDYVHLQLTRTPSHNSPPELLHESDDESDEDTMPPSPPAPQMPVDFSQKSEQSISHHTAQEESFYEEGFYLPARQVAVY
jgi:hypothetical protein